MKLMKNTGFVLGLFLALALGSCSKNSAKSYEGTYDVEFVQDFGEKFLGTMVITESKKILTIVCDVPGTEPRDFTLIAEDNGQDYFEINKDRYGQFNITDGTVYKVDGMIEISVNLYIPRPDWSVSSSFEMNEK